MLSSDLYTHTCGEQMISAPPRKRPFPSSQSSSKKAKPTPAVQAWVKKHIAKASELKTKLVSSSTTVNGATGWFTLLNGIAQGVSGDERIGRDLKIEDVNVKLNLALASSAVNGDSLRVIIFKDKEARGSTPVIGDILNFTSTATLANVSPYNQSNLDRFKFMYDRTFDLEPTVYNTTTTSTGGIYKSITISAKDGALARYFNSSGSSVADIDSGAIWLYVGAIQASTVATMASLVNFRDP